MLEVLQLLEVTASLFQLNHGLDRLFDWGFSIRSLAEIDVDEIDTQPIQALLTGFLGIFGSANDFACAIYMVAAELGHQNDL